MSTANKAPPHAPPPSPPKILQILLFSATFNERVKRFAQKIVPDANQARQGGWRWPRCVQGAGLSLAPPVPPGRLLAHVLTRPPAHPPPPPQVYVPKEELSLDVIKQYRVVSGTAVRRVQRRVRGRRRSCPPPSPYCLSTAPRPPTRSASCGTPSFHRQAIPFSASASICAAGGEWRGAVVVLARRQLPPPPPCCRTPRPHTPCPPQCEKLGQTIIFVRSRETARALHSVVRPPRAHRCAAPPSGAAVPCVARGAAAALRSPRIVTP